MEHNDVFYLSKRRAIRFGQNKKCQIVREHCCYSHKVPAKTKDRVDHVATAVRIGTASFLKLMNLKSNKTQVFSVTMQEINKTLDEKYRSTRRHS